MRSRILHVSCLLILLAFTFGAGVVQAQVIMATPPTNLDSLVSQYGLTVTQPLSPNNGVYLVSPPSGVTPDQLAGMLSSNPMVQAAEPDSPMQSAETSAASQATTNLSQILMELSNTKTISYFGSTVRWIYAHQPASALIHVGKALRNYPSGGPIVAIIDTGVDPYHPALANSLVNGYDFTRNQPGIPNEWLDLNATETNALSQSSTVSTDQKNQPFARQSTVVILDQSTVVILDGDNTFPADFGHGTMMAGLVHLVAPTAQIMPLKAFQADGSANLSDIIRAIYYAVNNGASVISMSFDTVTPSPDLLAAITYAFNSGVICIAASGNEGMQQMTYPAGFPGVLGVGSTTPIDSRSVFSNYGEPSVFMAAPGEGVITTFPGNNYAALWGTSVSSALVAGTAALMVDVNSGFNWEMAIGPFENCVILPPILGLGNSRLDVYLALQNLTSQESSQGGSGSEGNGQGGNGQGGNGQGGN